MLPLLQKAINAHGGAERWADIKELHLGFKISGAIWHVKGQPDILSRFSASIDTRTQTVRMQFPDADDHRSEFTPDLTVLHTPPGIVERRQQPRDRFDGHFIATPWDAADAVYFCSYALWTYYNSPFLFSRPGVTVRTVSTPWNEGSESWERLHITYPDSLTTHGREAVAYIDKDGLVRRYDYVVDIMGGAVGANYADDYENYDGILLPRRRRVYAYDATGRPQEPILVDIELTDARLS
ncbi:hypothetical protein [Dyella psychrodurans]|uniref:Uncharacterized protein n=1 Tax=Dyella psychrodurans TaxID=1927960 RepID=A0A370XCW3_9GAMM|nr:hypothetical protein [Dyella psychrodurans]RDS86097.1 hypothetical protein DWU99_02170 [Dyella psychrodurans]